jgi:hypothetical protein
LDVRLDNTRPIEVSDLGNALNALGKQYEEFVVTHGFDQIAGNARLFVTHIETGSIIVTLQSLGPSTLSGVTEYWASARRISRA